MYDDINRMYELGMKIYCIYIYAKSHCRRSRQRREEKNNLLVLFVWYWYIYGMSFQG